MNRQLIGKVPSAGKDQGQKEKRASEDEMAGRHHKCNEPEPGQTPGVGQGPGGLACCSPRGCRDGQDWAAEQQQQAPNKKALLLISIVRFTPECTLPVTSTAGILEEGT